MISAVCFLSDDRAFRIWLGLFNRSLRLLFHPFLWLHAPVPLSGSVSPLPWWEGSVTAPCRHHRHLPWLGTSSHSSWGWDPPGLHSKPWLCPLFSSCLLTWDPPTHLSLAFAMTLFCCPTFCPSTHHGSVLKKSILQMLSAWLSYVLLSPCQGSEITGVWNH